MPLHTVSIQTPADRRTVNGASDGPRLGVDQGVTREINRGIVLGLIRSDGPLSRAAIARRAGLAKGTVSSVVEQLIAAGVVAETGQGTSAPSGGRPGRLVSFNPTSRHLVGIAIGARQTSVIVTDALGDTLLRRNAKTPAATPERVLAAAGRLVRRAVSETAATNDSIAAVGVVVPGIVDPRTSVCLLAPNLGWHDVAVRDLIAAELTASPAPIFVHNTAQAVAVAEACEGAAVGHEDVACVYASIGIGAGMLRHGQVVLGSGGVAGELGHCVVPGGDRRCNCGNTGCLETLVSGPAIERTAAEAVARGDNTTLAGLGRDPTARDVAAAAASGDAIAGAIIGDAARLLGVATSWLVNITNPSMVVVAGGLAEIGAPLLEPMGTELRRHAVAQAVGGLQVRASALGADGPIRGAVLLARQYADEHFRSVFRSNS
jgi:predicted NBD/HSP70 family sugar kinase